MEKKLLNSEEEYFNLCVGENIGEVSRRYCSQYCYIDGGIPCDVSYDGTETLHIDTKPTSYPCIFVWRLEEDSRDHDIFNGQFIYEKDFKHKE